MSSFLEPNIKQALMKTLPERIQQDFDVIYSYLSEMDIISYIRKSQLRLMSKTARYEKYIAGDILFCRDSIASCWYILLSGSVLIKDSIYLPRCRYCMLFVT
ncbi:rap guanine nucleotide exchange factor 6-like [Protopterus annectens]|uniref:rap guanine nucleotide exchange factor 6-like n=1 Tax=Protopterus annectens TaxID=7888 RepID=UPI001CFC305E|nr:rap guanine nucleotide exchange factor 6-like [Protopterus annectens]